MQLRSFTNPHPSPHPGQRVHPAHACKKHGVLHATRASHTCATCTTPSHLTDWCATMRDSPVIVVRHDVQLVVVPQSRRGGQELVTCSMPSMGHNTSCLVLEGKGAHILSLQLGGMRGRVGGAKEGKRFCCVGLRSFSFNVGEGSGRRASK